MSAESRLPNGEWRCIVDNRTEPCGDCLGCRQVQEINAWSAERVVTGGSGTEPDSASAQSDQTGPS